MKCIYTQHKNHYVLPSQQSAEKSQLLPVTPVALQLLVPQVRLPAQSESVSQSPSPVLH